MNLGMQLSARPQLAMTPELQHSIRLLQLSAQEFEQEIEEALASNPFLERVDSDAGGTVDGVDTGEGGDAVAATAIDATDTTNDTSNDAATESQSDTTDFSDSNASDDWDSGDGQGAITAYRDPSDDADIGSYSPAPVKLREHLLSQLRTLRIDDRILEISALIVHALDPDGYLREPLEELADLCQPSAESDELAIGIRLVQSLEPAGVGARSMVECLLLQLAEADADDPAIVLARRMLTEQVDLLAQHDSMRLRRQLNCDDETLREAFARIRRCNPRPGSNFGSNNTQYVVADVIVRKRGKGWAASINPEVVPKVCLNQMYANIVQQQSGTRAAPIGQKLQEARWFLRNVQQRFRTIQRVAQAILDRQGRYFDYGDVAIKPLVLRDIAEELGIHESTVSRVTSNKFMATPRGLIEFKFFFGSHVESDGNALSSTAVRSLIRQIILTETRGTPLSDIKVTRILEEKGVHLARRTVSKYRDAMKIPPVEARRLTATA